MTANIHRKIAQHLIDESPSKYVDTVSVGDIEEGPVIAATFVDADAGVLFYTDGVDHSEAWEGDAEELKEKGEELIAREIQEFRRASVDPAIEYDESHDPLFEIPEHEDAP